jgi:hypothetical protein
VSDETRRLLARLLEIAEQRAHQARPRAAFRPLRFYVRRCAHRSYLRRDSNVKVRARC